MKLNKQWIFAALVVGSVLATGNLSAQDIPKDQAPGTQVVPGMKSGRPDFATALSLTEDQKPKFQEIMQAAMQKRKALRQDTSLTFQDKRTKAKAIQEDTTSALKGLLTEEQFSKWKTMTEGLRRGPAGTPKTEAKSQVPK